MAESTPVLIKKLMSAMMTTGRKSVGDSCSKVEKSAFSRLNTIKMIATPNKIHLFFIAALNVEINDLFCKCAGACTADFIDVIGHTATAGVALSKMA